MAARLPLGAAAALTLAAALPAPAPAAPPPNDPPGGAAPFEPYDAVNGRPREHFAIAELAEAGPDPGVPRCLGRDSFARTVWFRVAAAPHAQELTIDASGRTLDVVDLAAFVQPPDSAPVAGEPNACAGLGAGRADAAEDPSSAVALRVPPHHSVLVQAGRRGAAGHPDDEQALLSLDARAIEQLAPPPGDHAAGRVPAARSSRATTVELAHATVTPEDPAQPPCPALGTVWRKLTPGSSGRRLISVTGTGAATLAVFSGRRPTAGNVLDCVTRAGYGALQMNVPARKRRPLWIRIGADSLGARPARLTVGRGARVVDGGPGGFDPTTGGPGGGLPRACDRARGERARVSGRFASLAGARRVIARLRVRRSAICDVELRLAGPRGRVYARAVARRLKGRRTVRLTRVRAMRAGRYRLRLRALSTTGRRVEVRARVRGRLP